MQKVTRHFIADGSAINIDFGSEPDQIHAFAALGGTEVEYWWYKILADLETSGQYGITYDGTSALPAACADADNGFIPYDGVKTPRVRIPAPDGNGQTVTTVYGDWSASVDYSSVGTARSTTAVGTVVRPPTHNGKVFELITATGSGTSAPTTWDVAPGETVTDGGSNVWICREEDIVNEGGKGITVGATISTDSNIWIIEAEWHDDTPKTLGDAASKDPI